MSAHDVVLSEWDRVQRAGIGLTPNDRLVAAQLRETRRLELLELRNGEVRVETRGWIGIVRLESCTIRVEPRLIDGHQNLIALLDYVHRLSLVKRLSSGASFEAEGADLFDLMAWLLAAECDRVLRIGVQADYIPQRDELTALRGRLDVRAQLLRRFGQLDRLVCHFEERVRDIPENRWLLRALRLARRGVTDERVSAFVKRTSSAWEELCDDPAAEALDKPMITRTNHHYRDALELAYLLIDGVTTSNVLRAGRASGFSFMLNMARLFEEFTARVLEDLLVGSEVRVQRQAVNRSILWDPDALRPFGHLRPDILLMAGGHEARLPIDAKYKDYDVEKLQPGDLYQAAIYALAMGSVSARTGRKHSLLLHPTRGAAPSARGARVHIQVDGVAQAEVMRCSLNVATLLGELRERRFGTESSALIRAVSHVASCFAPLSARLRLVNQ